VAVIGDNTFWPGGQGRWITTDNPRIGEKILVIEIPSSDIRWTEPGDITLKEALRLFSAEEGGLRDSGHPGGLHYLTVNGQIKQFSSIKSVEEFATLLQLDPREEGP